MAQLFQTPFDANTVKPNEAFEPLPAGWYNARIIASEAKPTKDNSGGYLELQLEIIDGEHANRKVFDRLNLWNGGANAVKVCEIAQRQLSAYCHATGVLILQDSNQLHGIPLKIKLAVRTQEGFEPSNDVKAVKHIQDGGAAVAPASPFAAPAPAASPFAPPAAAPAVAPFGQNPALPPQPAQPSFMQGPPVTAAPAAAPWSPPAVPADAPSAGPVPPWRK
jgi:hypothetical protein